MSSTISRIAVRLGVEEWRRPGGPLYGPGHALLLQILHRLSPTVSAELHDANVRKPFALSPLTVHTRGNGTAEACLSINVWDTELANALTAALSDALDIRATVQNAPAVVLDVITEPPVALDSLLPDQAPPAVRVRFDSPTFFSLGRRAGHQHYGLLPIPELVVTSWFKTWERAGGQVNDSVDATALRESLTLREVHDLHTQVVRGEKTALTGFTGSATYAWIGADAWGGRLLAALAVFAQYCGTGAKTGHGFGRTSLAPIRRGIPGHS